MKPVSGRLTSNSVDADGIIYTDWVEGREAGCRRCPAGASALALALPLALPLLLLPLRRLRLALAPPPVKLLELGASLAGPLLQKLPAGSRGAGHVAPGTPGKGAASKEENPAPL